MLLHDLLENSARLYPGQTALVHDSDRLSYRDLNRQAERLAHRLCSCGIGKGERVALLLENGADYVISYFAALKIGAIAAPLNPGLKPEGLQYILNDLQPAAVVAGHKSERLLKAAALDHTCLKVLIIRAPRQKWIDGSFVFLRLEECLASEEEGAVGRAADPADLAAIIYTSGSTGGPKGVMLSHANLVSNAQAICQFLHLTRDDIQMVVLPFFYVMGQSLLTTHVAVGGTLVINNRFLYPADVVQQMIDERVTGFSGVPSTYAYLLNRSPLSACRQKLPHLRYCSQAGGHMAAALKTALRRALPEHTRIYIMYGATEASARLTYLEPELFESKMNSIGKPIPGVSIRILDEQGREVADGSEGELVASGPNIMQGYWRAPRESAQVLDAQGYHTGDIGYRDPDGFLYVLRRRDGLLKVGGHRVNPVEIEDFLLETGLLIEAAVVGLPDSLLGQKLIAVVVPQQETVDSRTVLEKCAAGLPAHKVPAAVVTARALPKNASGKTDRPECAAVAERYLSRTDVHKN